VDWVFKVRASSYTGFYWRQADCCDVVITGTYAYDKYSLCWRDRSREIETSPSQLRAVLNSVRQSKAAQTRSNGYQNQPHSLVLRTCIKHRCAGHWTKIFLGAYPHGGSCDPAYTYIGFRNFCQKSTVSASKHSLLLLSAVIINVRRLYQAERKQQSDNNQLHIP
jgi:hypothetical protein